MTIIYIRCSTSEQEPEIQLRDIRELNPPEDVLIIKENQSAWKDNIKRPEFNRVLALIKTRKVEALYVWSLDRIYRNRTRLKDFLTICNNYNTKIYSFNQTWLQSIHQMAAPFNEIVFDLFLQIVGWIAEEESTTKSNRVKMAVRKEETGTYSYKGNKWGRKSLPKQTIDKVLQLFSEGRSIREIAKLVQVYDKNKNGRQISKSAVHKLVAQNAVEKGS